MRLFAGGVATSIVSNVKKVFIDNSPLGVITWQNTTQVRRGSVFDVQLGWQVLNELRTTTLQLQISTDSINYQTIQTFAAGGTVIGIRNYLATVTNLNPGKYYFRILLSGDNCRTLYSGVQVVELKACPGVLKVYPNPVRETLKVLTPECEAGDLRVINAIGQSVILIRGNPAGSAIDIDCSRLASGLYLLQYVGSKSSSVVKFEKL